MTDDGGHGTLPQVVFTFYPEIISNPEVVQLIVVVTRTIEKSFGRVNKQLDAYRKYDQLWKMDKQQHLSKFEQKNPTCVMFDHRFQSYSRVVSEARAMAVEVEVDFILIAVSTLLHDIQEHARGWIQAIARLMNSMVRQPLVDMHEEVTAMSAQLEREPDTLEDLKGVLNLVTEIAARSMDMELEYTSLEEKYRTLRMYGYVVPADEADIVDNIRSRWEALCEKAKVRDRSLGRVKQQFTLVTQGQVSEFQAEVKAMHEDFTMRGPGTGGVDLDAGCEMMDQYTIQLGEMMRSREHLGVALKLFGQLNP